MGDSVPGAKPIKLVLCDDHPFVLMGLRQLFETGGFDVLQTCEDGVAALAAVRRHQPDVLVLDLQMPGLDGFAVLREMQNERLATRPVVLTASPGASQTAKLSALGAKAVLRKTEAPDRLVQCVREVHGGAIWLDPLATAPAATVDPSPRRDQLRQLLTPREIEIVDTVALALPNKVIAQRLGITEGTVKLHLHRIYDKLKLRGRMDLLLYLTERPAEVR
jgi:DNA-binding NarL/FixJ family response regulator